MKSEYLEVLFKVGLDILCIFIFSIPLWVYNLLDVVPITHNGFFCNDDSIRYPYHDSTVSSAESFIFGFSIFVLVILPVEILLFKKYHSDIRKSPVHPLVIELYRVFGYYIVGVAVNQFLTDVLKLSIGALRPHFLDVCQPNVTCSPENQYVYVENYVCTRTSHPIIPAEDIPMRQSKARRSFPSGHSSYSIYTAVFLVVYIEYLIRSRHTRLFRHIAQTGLMAWAFWVCSTRIHDFKHRYSDVAAGALLGSMVAAFISYAYTRSRRSSSRIGDVESNSQSPERTRPEHFNAHSNGAIDVSFSQLSNVTAA